MFGPRAWAPRGKGRESSGRRDAAWEGRGRPLEGNLGNIGEMIGPTDGNCSAADRSHVAGDEDMVNRRSEKAGCPSGPRAPGIGGTLGLRVAEPGARCQRTVALCGVKVSCEDQGSRGGIRERDDSVEIVSPLRHEARKGWCRMHSDEHRQRWVSTGDGDGAKCRRRSDGRGAGATDIPHHERGRSNVTVMGLAKS